MSDGEVNEKEGHSQRVSDTSSQPNMNEESAFGKLIGNINEAGRKTEDLDRIRGVIQSLNDFQKEDVQESINMNIYMNNVSQFPNLNGNNFKAEYGGEGESKTKDGQQNRTGANKDQKKQQEGPPEIKIILIIKSRNKKADPPKKEEKKDNGHENKAGTSDGKKPKPSKNNPNLMKNFNKNVALLKGVYNYIQPLIMCDESITEIRKNEEKEMSAEFKKLYFIVSTTRNCLCHLHCFFNETLTRKMHSNITNLYDILGVDLNEKHRQKEIYNDNKTYDKFYYYGKGGVMYPNDSKPLIEVSRDTINRTIKLLIMRGHSEGEVKDSDSKSIILFGKLLHHLVGTRDKNWKKITGYFDGYEFESLKDGGNGDSSADPAAGQNGETKNNLNITLKRRNKNDFFFEAIKLKLHWAQMLLRDEGAGGSNIAEIHRALAADIISTPSGDLHLEIPSEKKEQLNKITNSIESIDQSASADKVDSDGIDDFFKKLINCKKYVYISSGVSKILSNNPQLPPDDPAELKQLNERLTANFTADSNRLIICPLKIQNQWFLFVADRKNNRCSLYGCLGNDSVSAPHVQNLCETFVSNLKKLESLEKLKDIPKGELKDQPQNIVEDCGSLICSLAFNLVYCPLHLYPKDVPRIIMAIKMKKNEP